MRVWKSKDPDQAWHSVGPDLSDHQQTTKFTGCNTIIFLYVLMLKKSPPWTLYNMVIFNLHCNLGLTYRPTLCGWSPSPTCPANLTDCGNNFLFQQDNAPISAGHIIPPWLAFSNGPPLGYSISASTCLVSLPRMPAGWTTARGGLIQMHTQVLSIAYTEGS